MMVVWRNCNKHYQTFYSNNGFGTALLYGYSNGITTSW